MRASAKHNGRMPRKRIGSGRELSADQTRVAPRHVAASARDELRVESWDDTPGARAEWDSLAERTGNVFATAQWAMAWWRHWGRDRRRLTTSCRRPDGSLAAMLPLYEASRPSLRVLRFIGHGPGDSLGPVCEPADRGATAAALRRLLASGDARWDLLVAQQVPAADGWAAALAGTVVRRERSPSLSLDWPSWDDYLASRSANFRQQVRRRERRLARQHNLRFRLTTTTDTLHNDLDVLFALHEARWGTDASAALAAGRRPFHREFAARALERGWLRLWFLELDGEPVAAWYGFRLGGVESYYQAGRNPAWDRWSVGAVLLAHTIRSALDDGIRDYRFLRGGEPYKDRFTDDEGELETFLVSRGVRGVAAAAVARTAARRRSSTGPLAALRRLAGLGNASVVW
jgi:CelD/BcsL family acetyltransferase involved in cellulose biosynthesis